MSKQVKPAPVVVSTICSMCGLAWEQHGEDPTTEDCIRLLKLELARRPAWINVQPVRPQRYQPYRPYWNVTSSPPVTICSTVKTPRIAELSS